MAIENVVQFFILLIDQIDRGKRDEWLLYIKTASRVVDM